MRKQNRKPGGTSPKNPLKILKKAEKKVPLAADNPFPIVGIGGSAGGLEAYKRFFKKIAPDTGMAFVVIQHLDPKSESVLAKLLTPLTGMPTQTVTKTARVRPDHVYVIPPAMDIAILDGELSLVPRVKAGKHGLHLPVDYFFRLLAEVQADKAIGIVMSGRGSDGTLGLKAIKAEGGLTFAQNPKTAQYGDMPRSAIVSESVDFVLSPEEIADELVKLSKSPLLLGENAEAMGSAREDENSLRKIFNLLKKFSGVDFAFYKQSTVKRRLLRRTLVHKLDSLAEYAAYVETHPEEVAALYQDMLIRVTGFFRDPEVFNALKKTVYPRLVRKRPADSPIRVWVAGCSTGEEAYSFAICLLEFLANLPVPPAVQVFATDVSDVALEKARAGIYPDNIALDISAQRLRKFFAKVDGGYQISKHIRDMCVFAKQNLMKDPPFSRLDLISCRNVMIYLEPSQQKKVIPVFHYALKPNGFLVLGASETVGAAANLFELTDKKNKIYGKKGVSTRFHFDFSSVPSVEKSGPPKRVPADPGSSSLTLARKEADRIILSKYAPAGVLVDENLEIIQFRGETEVFLKHPEGDANLKFLKMLPNDLALDLRAAIQESKSLASEIWRPGVKIKGATVNIGVIPIRVFPSDEFYYLVVFENSRNQPRASPVDAPRASTALVNRDVKALKRELEEAKKHLQAIIEEQEATNDELQTANEEVLSSNEELQSINEELETAKEELQSTNEELTTVNEEMVNRNAELSRANNDLNNLLLSVSIPIVMLGSDLRIRRFTPQAEKIMNLIPSDAGRPIGDIKPNIDVNEIEPLVLDVIDTMKTRELEVQNKDGHWYSMRIRPYRTADNKIEGAVIAFVDIDELKRSMESHQEARDYAEAIVETVWEPLLVLDEHLRVQTANQSFYRTFQIPHADTRNVFVYNLGGGEWNVPGLHKILEESLRDADRCENVEIEHEFERLGRKTMLVNARRVYRENRDHKRYEMILIAIEDITQRRKVEAELKANLEARYRKIFEATQDGIFFMDEDGLVTDVNPSLIKLLGYSRDEWIGKNWQDIAALQGLEQDHVNLNRLKRAHNHFPRLVLRSKSGPPVEAEMITNAYPVGGNKVIQCDIRDMRERNRALEAEKKEMLLKEIHHRVKNNLQVVSSLLNLQSGYFTDERTREIFKESQNRVRSMAIIHEKLCLSEDMVRIDFGEYMRDLTKHLFRTYGRDPGKILLKIDIDGLLLSADTAIPVSLIINELVSNALKYAFPEETGVIRIALTRQDGGLVLTVADDGIGFPPKLDFKKTESLGLQLVMTLAEQLHGEVDLKSPPGTEFQIKFNEVGDSR